MTDIKITKILENEKEYSFEVKIVEGESNTSHKITLQKEHYKALSTQSAPKVIVLKSFEFLLKREPKEAILAEFDLQLISNYFPEYSSESTSF